MRNVRTIAAGIGIAGTLGIAALGIGAGTAGAEPPSPVTKADFAQIPEWGGPGPWRPGPGPWGPPPPPAWGYGGYGGYGGYEGYGGYAPGPPCISGPLGFLQVCP